MKKLVLLAGFSLTNMALAEGSPKYAVGTCFEGAVSTVEITEVTNVAYRITEHVLLMSTTTLISHAKFEDGVDKMGFTPIKCSELKKDN